MNDWGPYAYARLVGVVAGFAAAFSVALWAERALQLGPWVMGRAVCDSAGEISTCITYLPAGLMLLGFVLVPAGAIAAEQMLDVLLKIHHYHAK